MDTSRPFFVVRPGEALGEKLVWRYPFRSRAIRDRLIASVPPGKSPPAQITLGYYLQLEDPDGAWAFMPLNSPLAIAALGIDSVQRRICADLQARIARDRPLTRR